MKIIDFGLSQRLVKGKELKTLCGTAEFVAPEVKMINQKLHIGVVQSRIVLFCNPMTNFHFSFSEGCQL